MAHIVTQPTTTWTIATSSTTNITYSYTFTSNSTGFAQNSVTWRPAPPPPKHRGWNGKQQMRCVSCGKWAKQLQSKMVVGHGRQLAPVKCKRCGEGPGYLGRHPLA